ncbi:MAG: DEAD/DEAH box helicase [Candidatus Methanomethylicia archaeon]
MRISDLNIDGRVKELLVRYGYVELYPPQVDAIRAGILNGVDTVVAIPTAAGKTLIAELTIVNRILKHGGKALYFTPLRALASEKFNDLMKYSELGLKVAITTGDYDSANEWLEKYDIIVSTYEKTDSLTRHMPKWIRELSIIVADEVHLINDGERGPILEVLLTKLISLNPNAQVLALSATVSNAEEIAKWLRNAKLIASDWRPVKLREGVYYRGSIEFNDGVIVEVPYLTSNSTINIALDTLVNGGQALIFTSSRAQAVSLARKLSNYTHQYLSKEEGKELRELSKKILALEPITSINSILSECIKCGVAFHHAGLAHPHRKIIEDTFRSRILKVVCATPTLAAGVNLPARRVVIDSINRYEVGIGSVQIPILEYKQMAGRAGRPKYDSIGEAVIIAGSKASFNTLMSKYVLGRPERLTSKLASEKALRTHILSLIASEFTGSEDELMDFMEKTFFGIQYGAYSIKNRVKRVLEFLEDNELITASRRLKATILGRRVSQLYIDPKSAVIIRRGLEKAKDIKPTSILHLLCSTPDMPKIYLGRREEEKYLAILEEVEEELLIDTSLYDYDMLLAELKTAMMLNSWINEEGEEKICEEYGIWPGDLYVYVETADWLTYSITEIAKVIGKKEIVTPLQSINSRVKNGVREELLDLVKLEGIGRVRARMLYNSGFKTIDDLKKATIEQLSSIPLIGKTLAVRIKNQLGKT